MSIDNFGSVEQQPLEGLVRQLLIAPNSIACIYQELLDDEYGISIIYKHGSSYWKSFGTREKQQEVWNLLLQIRPRLLIRFCNVLFDPMDANLITVGADELVIEIVDHKMVFRERKPRLAYCNA